VGNESKPNESKPEEPEVRVVDRRWWARADQEAGSDEGGARKPTYVEALEQQISEQAAQLQASLTDRRKSLEEFEQAKARIRREVARDVERARRAVLAELLDVVDNLDRAIASAQAPATPLLRGVELVRDQLLSKLEAFGATRMAALGKPFDARYHEAVTMSIVDDPTQDGTVVAVLKEGFAIGDDILRPASVVVGKRDGQS
jgi:molecular chaperone GrpE